MDPNNTPAANDVRQSMRGSMHRNGDVMRKPAVEDDRRATIRRAEDQGRTLTDADVEALVDRLSAVLEDRIYRNLGKGVWGIAQKAFIALVITLAGYGYIKGIK